MPIGGRNPNTNGQPQVAVIPAGSSPDDLGAQIANAIAAQSPEWFWQTQSAVDTYFAEFGGNIPVATFPAPQPGTYNVIERLIISSGAPTSIILVGIGDLNSQNTVDLAQNVTAYSIVSSDPQPLRIPAGQSLWIAWTGATLTSGLYAKTQTRVEVV